MQSTAVGIKALFVHRSDAFLVTAVLFILSMLVIPLPTWMLDGLIAVNIATAALILLMSLYVPDASKFAAFPSILLLTTLFRLALNVSSTRLILGDAYAGNIIQAFGDFVVSGNYIVGGIIFLILVLIQFIVIAKGSERVAEVAARFTLDAMPGKQMSIDADLRAGLLTAEQARMRREAIERESQLYGAMDGAMKFVKGDAIAGIVITTVNIVGGLIIGKMQMGMGLGEAAQTYSLLTIGDGLVSQIPALLLSTSAGLVVTRVASGGKSSDGEDAHMAQDMFQQVFAQPRAIGFCALILFAAAWIPGFPKIVFFALATIALGIWIVLQFTAAASTEIECLDAKSGLDETGGVFESSANPNAAHDPAAPRPIVLELHGSLRAVYMPGNDPARKREFEGDLNKRLAEMRIAMGVDYPSVRIKEDCDHLPENGYALLIHEAYIAEGMLAPDQHLILGAERNARSVGIRTKQIRTPWNSQLACVITSAQVEQADKGGLKTIDAREILLRHTIRTIRRYSREFIGLQETEAMLNRLRQTHSIVVQQVTPKPISLQLLTETLQRLVAEEIPIRNFRGILESLVKWGRQLQQPMAQDLADLVRRDLRRTITAHYAVGRAQLSYLQIGHGLSHLFRTVLEKTPRGMEIVLSPDDRRRVIEAITQTLDGISQNDRLPVIICEDPYRNLIRETIAWDFPGLGVMCWSEVAPEVRQQCVGVVDVAEARPEAEAELAK